MQGNRVPYIMERLGAQKAPLLQGALVKGEGGDRMEADLRELPS